MDTGAAPALLLTYGAFRTLLPATLAPDAQIAAQGQAHRLSVLKAAGAGTGTWPPVSFLRAAEPQLVLWPQETTYPPAVSEYLTTQVTAARVEADSLVEVVSDGAAFWVVRHSGGAAVRPETDRSDVSQGAAFRPATAATGSPPEAHHAANSSEANSRNVLTRWMAIAHAADRIIVRGQPKQHQPCAHERFQNDENARQDQRLAPSAAPCEEPPTPNDQRSHEDQAHAGRDPVAELDDGLQLRRRRDHFAVAERPVAAAARAGTRRAHECTHRITRTLYRNKPHERP